MLTRNKVVANAGDGGFCKSHHNDHFHYGEATVEIFVYTGTRKFSFSYNVDTVS